MRHARQERRRAGRPARRVLLVALLGLSLLAPAGTASQAAGGSALPSAEAPAAEAGPAPADPETAAPTGSGEDVPDEHPAAGDEPPVESPEPESVEAPAAEEPAPEERPVAVQQRTVVAPMAVPTPARDESVVTVKVGSTRSDGGITPAAGARLALFDSLAKADPIAESWAKCTSDAAGDCSFTIPDTRGLWSSNRDRELYVKALSAPEGYHVLSEVGVGSGTTLQSPYGFRVGEETSFLGLRSWQLRGGQTYRSTPDSTGGAHFMGHRLAQEEKVSSGWFPVVRDNEELAPQCGLDVALVLDLSGSIAGHEDALAKAASALVDGLTGTPSSVALFSFSTGSPATVWSGRNTNDVIVANRPEPHQVATAEGAATVKRWYSRPSGEASFTGSGGTNWDRALHAPAAAEHDYDVAIVITDGNPTFFGPAASNGSQTRPVEIEHGIFSANLLKEQGTRVIAMGVGSGVDSTGSGRNLQAISGPARGADYYQTSNYESAAAQLRELALGSCRGSVSVVKEVVPHATTGEDVTGSQPASGWTFTATAAHPGVEVRASGTTDATGAVNFPITFPQAGATTGLRITEQQREGYSLVTQEGKNAVCRHLVTGASVPVTNVEDGFELTGVTAADPISCTVYNREPVPHASLTVDKQWVVDGELHPHGEQPDGWDARLVLSTEDRGAWGTRYTGYVAGDAVTIAEDMGALPPLCTLESAELTREGGGPSPLPAGGAEVSLELGDNHYTVTNTVSCTQELTLTKAVAHGSAPADSWTLTATSGDAVALRGPDGVTGEVDHGVPYELAESGGPAEYVQDGEWSCLTSEDRSVAADDAIVTVPRGAEVTCTVTNVTATLTLLKHVENPDPGSGFVPAAWTLSATPDDGVELATPAVTGSADVTTDNTVEVRPGHRYTLTEALSGGGNPLAYRHLSLERYTGTSPDAPELDPSWESVDTAVVTLRPGAHEVYRFVNAPVPAPELPLTGGLGPTTYLVLGGLLLALALGVGALHRVRSRRA